MAVRGISRGSGITKRVVPALSGDMRAADMGQTLLYTAGGGSFEGWIREPEAMARTILQGAGHDPDRPGSVAAEDDTPVDYSARILRLIQTVRRSRSVGWPASTTSRSIGKSRHYAGAPLSKDQSGIEAMPSAD